MTREADSGRDAATESWPYPRLLAHRGGGTLAPENTLAAIRIGYSYGLRAIECDAMLAADRVPVLIHDPTLLRTTRVHGEVASTPSEQLGRLDAGSWHSQRFAGEPVPTLDRVLEFCRASGVWINVEIKPAPGHEPDTGAVVAQAVARHYPGGAGRDPERVAAGQMPAPLLSSFSVAALAAARAAEPGLRRGLLCDRPAPDWHAQLVALQCVALHCNHRALDAPLAARVKAAGYGLLCYTVNSPRRAAQLRGWGVDAICTDRIDLFAAAPDR